METVAGEKPLDFATSLIVIVWFLPLCRFTGLGASAGTTIILLESLMMQWALLKRTRHSGGTSNDSGSRKPRVFQTPNAMPRIIHALPSLRAGLLRFHHSPRQTKNPRIGGTKFSNPIPSSNVRKKDPTSTITPMKITLLRGTRCFSSTTPKKDFGNALLLPIPYSKRAAPICAPMPDPKLATSRVRPTIEKSGAHVRAAAKTYA